MKISVRLTVASFIAMATISVFAAGGCRISNNNIETKETIAAQDTIQPVNRYEMYEIASEFLNKPYVAGTLDKNLGEENLVINLDSVDCVTFVEYVTASLISGSKPSAYDSLYTNALKQLRYKNGKIDGYMSRLHYFSQWIYDNQEKGLVTEITDSFSSKPFNKEINFMSSHPEYYPAIEKNPEYLNQLKEDEKFINSIFKQYIPKADIRSQFDKFKEGDIIAITASTKGLDISHVGFIHMVDGIPHLMHASSNKMKVVVTDEDLASYLENKKSQTGIRVVRINNQD